MKKATRWVPIHDVFGKGPVPQEAAAVVQLAIKKARSATGAWDVPDWMILEWVCADFLAGPEYAAASIVTKKSEETEAEPPSSGKTESGTNGA